MTTDRLRRLRRIALFTGFGLVVFVVALYFSFPYQRAKEMAIRMASDKDLDVEIGSAGPAFGLGVTFHDIRVRTRPTTGKPTRFTVESARVSVSPLSLFSSSKSYTVLLDAFGGQIEFSQSGTPGKKKPFQLAVYAKGVKMNELPGVRETINLPLVGTAKVDFEVASETGRFADATGEITFSCEGCVLGDGKSPLRVAGNPFLSGGLTLPRVRLDDLGGHVAIDKGVAKLQGVEAKSPDGEIALEGEVTLRDPVAMSTVNAYLRFKLSDAFLKQAANVQTILQMAAAQGKRADGFYGMRLSGRLGQLNPPLLSPTSPITSSPAGPRPGIRASISPSSSGFKLPPQAPVPAASVAVVAPPPPDAPPPASPPPPSPPPPPPAAPPPTANPATGGWHGGATTPVVAEAGAPAAPESPPPPPPPPEVANPAQ
ncbi:MAG TPA: type II secretion system protein GspN [Polyangia bacterium]|nr:type II secretion system protein GspN [Polyangia bacterium]